jgi:hypothetical protein
MAGLVREEMVRAANPTWSEGIAHRQFCYSPVLGRPDAGLRDCRMRLNRHPAASQRGSSLGGLERAEKVGAARLDSYAISTGAINGGHRRGACYSASTSSGVGSPGG